MSKQNEISTAILAQVASGKSIDAAVDAVLGFGSFAKIAADAWEALRK